LKENILIVNLDHLLDKVSYQAKALKDKGFNSIFYTMDKSGLSEQKATANGLDLQIIPKGLFSNIKTYIKLIKKHNPKHIELYMANSFNVLLYSIIAFLFRKPIITISRGELYSWSRYPWYSKIAIRLCFLLSKLILVKETYMPEMIRRKKLASQNKLYEFHNKIIVHNEFTVSRDENIVLFLNSFKPWRNIDLIIKSIPSIIKNVPDAKFYFVGSTLNINSYNPTKTEYEESLRNLVSDLNVEKYVKFFPFTENAKSFFERAKLFVLPADLVYCNYSLLESMERGTPAIISDVEDSGLLVDNGHSGVITNRSSKSIAENIIKLLENEENRLRMGNAAREKVVNDFNMQKGVEELLHTYKSVLWK
jgi:glycosyltransferase involved in cell wall biosynthesis